MSPSLKKSKKIKVTERGWPAHFCAVSNCTFRRNTLVEYGNKRIVVSTVGNYQPHIIGENKDKHQNQIGCDRYYETMVFWAQKEGVYWEAKIGSEIPFKSKWAIDKLDQNTDREANEMHEKVVEEIKKKILSI